MAYSTLDEVVRPPLTKGEVIGLPVHPGSVEFMGARVCNWATHGESGYVCVANVHMLVTARLRPALREVLHEALMVTSDGMPLVWRLRQSGFQEATRVYGPDLTNEICTLASKEKVPVFFYGGTPDNLARFREALARRFPNLLVAGIEAPPLLPNHPPLDEGILARIRASGAKIVFVGLGCPKQEFWMKTHSEYLPAVLLGVGAAFDFLAGNKPHAPRWLQQAGLEWLYRLFSEPRRLWRRYLVTNTLFIYFLTIECLSHLVGAKERSRRNHSHRGSTVAEK